MTQLYPCSLCIVRRDIATVNKSHDPFRGHNASSRVVFRSILWHFIIPQNLFVMPESFVLAFFHREINLHSSDIGKTSNLPSSHPSEHGIPQFPLPHMSCFYVINALILRYIQISYCLLCSGQWQPADYNLASVQA